LIELKNHPPRDVIRTAEKPLRYGARIPAEDSAEMQRFRWVDEVLVHTLPPNIYRTPREALQAFAYIEAHSAAANWSLPARLGAQYLGAAAMWGISKRLKKCVDMRTLWGSKTKLPGSTAKLLGLTQLLWFFKC
jgi:hypothetical protein